jgi:diaminohydroxyphosphoribosylaminopyrimidine deaminase/5-amino-6-(5-phosphoribosylamino)uracil reductase
MGLDEIFMNRSIQLAGNGLGFTRPNPSVGCVVVYEGKIIGEGFTSPYGGSHAEVNAINSVKDKNLLEKATLYVTLEPCSHFGKTPPCADYIIKHKILKVVIGCVDTHSVVAGKGIERLISNGVDVVVGVLEEKCWEQHKRFFTVQNKNRPYVILKWAQTRDGFVAPAYKDTNRPVWISNAVSRQLVHKWRSEEHAILVGTNTALADNPKLDVRSWGGEAPVRIVLDRTLRVPKENNLFDRSIKTIVCTSVLLPNSDELLVYEQLNFENDLAKQLCAILMKHQIQSVIIEGGTQTLNSFIKEGVWDEARVFYGESNFNKGVKAPVLPVSSGVFSDLRGTVLKVFKNF